MARSLPKKKPLDGVKHIIIVASGKGGVGKSTTAVNLAIALSETGRNISLLDCDVFGPSIPLMMNLKEQPLVDDDNKMIPLINYNIKCMSMGLLVDESKPIVWRGPLVMSAVQRMLHGTRWSPTDILIIDTPPGTGDVHLSLAQNIPISGAVLVSTPQRAALEVMERGAGMYQAVKIPLIGIVENMSHAMCQNCGSKISIFTNNSESFARKLGIDILERLPIEDLVSDCSDQGVPLIIKQPNSKYSQTFRTIANKVIQYLDINK